MPIYEYQCAACGRITERWQKFSEDPLTTCPHCGGDLNKLISCCTFHLRGSGWYVTDYGGSRQGAPASTETSGETKEAQSTEDSAKPKENKEGQKSEAAAPPKFK